MIDKFPIQVALLVMAGGGAGEVLLTDHGSSLPSAYLAEGEQARDVAARSFEEILGFPAGSWSTIRALGLLEPDGRKVAAYAVELPMVTPAAAGHHWAEIDGLLSDPGAHEFALGVIRHALQPR